MKFKLYLFLVCILSTYIAFAGENKSNVSIKSDGSAILSEKYIKIILRDTTIPFKISEPFMYNN